MRIPYFLLLLSLAACRQPLTLPEARAFVARPENGLTQTRQVGDVATTCALALVAAPDTAADALAGNTYFSLSFSVAQRSVENFLTLNHQDSGPVLGYLNGGIARDARLRIGRDTIPAAGALYARQYGAASASTVLLVFRQDVRAAGQDVELLYRGNALGIGLVRFPFKAAHLRAVPPFHS